MANLKQSIAPIIALCFIICGCQPTEKPSVRQTITTKPSFHVNFSHRPGLPFSAPTSDKPQSKLWYMNSHWWALLNSSSGPTLWQRTGNGWKEHKEVSNSLKGIPGQADVWYENRTATAITVSDTFLYIIRLKPEDSSDARWQAKILNQLNIPHKDPDIETATIAKDAKGDWWVAADLGKAIYVWGSKDAIHWSNAILIGKNISSDDISSIAALKHSVIVIWSNQTGKYSVNVRKHTNGQPIDKWSAIDTVASGNRTADDHINTALSANGTLWATTKNSLDKINHPQLVLRVRTPDGNWKNYPYFPRESTVPSRPIINTTPNPDLILSCYTIYDHSNRYKDRIGCGIIDTSSTKILKKRTIIIAPDSSRKVQVNNVTGPKAPFPPNAPWIVLASDNKGNIYEADLRSFFSKNKINKPFNEKSNRSNSEGNKIIQPVVITDTTLTDTDDPAIWIDKTNKDSSLIIGTDKDPENGGLYAFNLKGDIVKTALGLKDANNVDVAYGLKLNRDRLDIAVTTERYAHKIRVFSLPDLEAIDGGGIPVFKGDKEKDRQPMGIGLYTRPSDHAIFAIVSRKRGPRKDYLEEYLLQDNGHGQVTGKLVRKFGRFSGKKEIEAVAVDNSLGYVYYCDETAGIRKYYADPAKGNQELAFFGRGDFKRDNEGISIYDLTDSTGYIIVSDQQANRFNIYPRRGKGVNHNKYKEIVSIPLAARVSDGSEVTSVSLPGFPHGLFVAMSDDKTFQYYRWQDIAESYGLNVKE